MNKFVWAAAPMLAMFLALGLAVLLIKLFL